MTLFPHPLWHGTSAHLLPMIEEHGLGGRDVMAEWRVMDFLSAALPYLKYDANDLDDPDFQEKMVINACIQKTAAGMNFLYGHLYVAGGYHRAASYASYAPEMVSFVRMALDIAERYGVSSVREILHAYPEIEAFLDQPSRPVVLKLPLVPLSTLEDERGGPVSPFVVDDDPAIDAVLLAQSSFRLNATIPLQEVEVIYL